MKQKLGLCCALIHDPDLLILDEPSTGVDPLSRRQFWELIGRIRARRSGMSVLVATAYMDEAEGFDWLVAMDAGKVLATGSPAELKSSWFLAVMQIINNITLMAILLTGAALIREREHGTIEHLLVMPLRPSEIMLAKVWANGLVIIIAATLSLWLVVHTVLGVPIAGSIPLFVLGTAIYLFSVTALGIFLATLARSMPQFGLLALPVFITMNLLSGGLTPLESMPKLLQVIMQFSPATHFVSLAQAILYRGAGLAVVWPEFVVVAAIGAVFFIAALLRFRKTVALMQL